MTELKSKAEALSGKVKSAVETKVGEFSDNFNALDSRTKKWNLILLGLSMACLCTAIAVRGFLSGDSGYLKPETITLPKDIYMDTLKAERLMPIGKMKGEIDGEFEAFYLATDKEGHLFINRNIEYSDSAYERTNGWEQITRKQLEFFERNLDMIPPRQKSLRR